jgi:hypothetical protein
LKLWLERKTLSEYIIRHHIREIETINEASFGSSRRPSRTERALNDPLRDNEGMLVDEYGRYDAIHFFLCVEMYNGLMTLIYMEQCDSVTCYCGI